MAFVMRNSGVSGWGDSFDTPSCWIWLQEGATTFWETEDGESAFDRAGSLCHGWSAMPIVYYHRLIG